MSMLALLFAMLFTPSALAIDASHAALQGVYDKVVASGRVDYAGLAAAPQAMDAYLVDVAKAVPASMGAADKKAFYINAYNALTIDMIADSWPLASIRDLDGGKVWDTRKFNVGGQQMSLDDIENKVLRPLGDPRIHAAINCASIGCPPLSSKVFVGSQLEGQLEAAAKRWAATATWAPGVLSVNNIFDWYGDDFVPLYGAKAFDIPGLDGKAEAAANFIAKYAPDKAAAIQAGNFQVRMQPYDWKVNAKK
jgi:hypothetical protein